MHPRAARGVTARCRGPSGTDAAPAGARAGGSPAWRAARPVGDRACLDRAASAGPPGWDGPGASTRDRTGRMPGRLPASWRRRMRARERACAPSAPGVPAARRASAAPAPRAVARRWHRCATRSRALDSPAGIDYLSLHAPRASGREPRLRRPSGPRARLLRRGARRVRRAARPERRGQDDALPRHAGAHPRARGPYRLRLRPPEGDPRPDLSAHRARGRPHGHLCPARAAVSRRPPRAPARGRVSRAGRPGRAGRPAVLGALGWAEAARAHRSGARRRARAFAARRAHGGHRPGSRARHHGPHRALESRARPHGRAREPPPPPRPRPREHRHLGGGRRGHQGADRGAPRPRAARRGLRRRGGVRARAMRGKRLTIYLGESDQWHHRPLYLAILEHLRTAGLAGATVTRGIAGFGAHSKIKTARLLELSVDLPIVITAVDRAERIERVLPEVAAMMAAGVMTVDDTEVHFYSAAFAGGLPAVSVGDVMTRDPEAVTPETPIADVVARLLARDFTALPVVDADGRVVGMIADSDLLEARLTEQRLGMSKVIGPALVAEQLARLKTAGATVRQAMTSPAVTVTATTPLADAARLMHARGLKRLPVVDAAGRLVGVLSRLDILGCVVAGGAHRTAPPSARLPQEHRTVAEIMDRDVPTVAATAPLGDVVERLLAAPTARVVVVDANGRPVGIVTDTDLLARVDPGERPGLLTLLRSRWSEAAAAEVRRHHGRRAADVMTAPVITVPTSASVLEALTLTVARHVKRLPVVDERGRVVGVVSRPALLAASLDLAPAGAIP